MKGKWGYIKLLFVLVLVGVLFGFVREWNNVWILLKIDVKFIDENNLFIILMLVNKLLI